MIVLAVAASIAPLIWIIEALSARDFATAVWSVSGVVGAGGFGYAAARMRKTDATALGGVMLTGGALGSLGVVVSFVVFHTVVGVPLALWYRRSRNLLVPAVAHAFIDAVRNGLIGAPL